jgi:hypothetical protein
MMVLKLRKSVVESETEMDHTGDKFISEKHKPIP